MYEYGGSLITAHYLKADYSILYIDIINVLFLIQKRLSAIFYFIFILNIKIGSILFNLKKCLSFKIEIEYVQMFCKKRYITTKFIFTDDFVFYEFAIFSYMLKGHRIVAFHRFIDILLIQKNSICGK